MSPKHLQILPFPLYLQPQISSNILSQSQQLGPETCLHVHSTTKKGFFSRLCDFTGAGTAFSLGALKPFVTELMVRRVKDPSAAGGVFCSCSDSCRLLQSPLDWAASLWQWQKEQLCGCFVLLRNIFSPFPFWRGVLYLSLYPWHLDEFSSGNFPPPLAGE